MIKKLYLSLFLSLALIGNVFAAEQIVDFETKSLPVLNEELKRIDSEINSILPAGIMMGWGTDTAPDGWLLCYGQAVSRKTYVRLYNVIGTTYGAGDASTTFNVPDFRGRFPLGQDDMGGTSANRVTDTDADTLGGADGDETKDISFSGNTGSVTLTAAQSGLPAHTHGIKRKTSGAIGTTHSPAHLSADTDTNDSQSSTLAIDGGAQNAAEGHLHTISGGSATQDFMNPYLTWNVIIKN